LKEESRFQLKMAKRLKKVSEGSDVLQYRTVEGQDISGLNTVLKAYEISFPTSLQIRRRIEDKFSLILGKGKSNLI
jgi:hypothetical protein